MLRQAGFEVQVCGFDRDYHRGRVPDGQIEILAKIPHGRYAQRALIMIGVLRRLRRMIRSTELVYASGPDMGFAAATASIGLNRPVVFEVGDIQRAQVAQSLSGQVVRAFDRHLAKKARLIVATAPGFIDEYYRGWLGSSSQTIVIENKLEPNPQTKSSRASAAIGDVAQEHSRPIRLGYFGLLRCRWAWSVLEILGVGDDPQGVAPCPASRA